jgi:hypothetical protein
MRFDAKALVIVALALLVFACGCQPKTHVPESLTQKLGGVEVDDQMEFWHQLADKRMTSNDDAFRGLLLYMDGKDQAKSYEDRIANLRSRKMLPKGFDEPADLAVSRGTLAVAISRLISLKGGVTMRLLGPSPRYAVRELMFVGVYPTSSPNQTFSGAEYVGIIGRVEDYQRGNPADVPAAVMPSEREEEKSSPPTSTLPPRRD